MSEYILNNIQKAQNGILFSDVFLVILYPNRIPPHLAVSVNGKLFSLDVKGPSLNKDLNVLLRSIQKNQWECLLVQLKMPELFTLEDLRREISKITAAYPAVQAGGVTCLAPIKDFCNSIYQTETSNVNFIFDLLPKLEQQGILNDCYHLNMDRYFILGNRFELKTYSMFEINETIHSLNGILV
ncbi:MAG: hypothetical protein COA57_03420 [Flavobacteriales bacterium]|nr:MAG: hypothetical protein COA57_03420 [Flavobacteriales bacterium]